MKNFLVTAIGSLSANAVLNVLKSRFEPCKIIGCDIYPGKWIANTSFVDVFYQVPNAGKKNYIETLLAICKKENIGYLIPLTDPEVDTLSENLTLFESFKTKVCISETSTIKICRNKLKYPEYFTNTKYFKTIPGYSESDLNKSDIKYPLIAKPLNGRSSEGLFLVENQDLLNSVRKHKHNYVFQPFIKGKIITVDVIRDTKNNIVSIPRIEHIRTKNGAGLTVKIFKDKKLQEIINTLAEELNITGCINIEFILADRVYYLLDINPRFSAGIAFSLKAGYNFVENHIKCFEDKEIDNICEYTEILATREYIEVFKE